jgi:chitin synthase
VEYFDLQHKMEHKLRMLICVTIYNETKSELFKTLQGIFENLESFLDHSISPHDIAVVVIFDGILKMDESMRSYFSTLDKELMLNFGLSIESRLSEIKKCSDAYIKAAEKVPLEHQKRKKEVAQGNYLGPSIPKRTSICYQIQLGIGDFAECSLIRRPEYIHLAKLNVFLCVKMLNKQKLSSHLWFFQGFCKTFQPEYCALVDCGTQPDKKGLWNFFRALETDRQAGGVCGYMGVRIEEGDNRIKQLPFKFDVDGSENFLYRGYLNLINIFLLILNYLIGVLEKIFSIQKAQEFEYCFAHIFDKGFESFFGFIAVLPGAWSAYRWDALSEDNLLEREYLQTVNINL